jgi:hypothetical protein
VLSVCDFQILCLLLFYTKLNHVGLKTILNMLFLLQAMVRTYKRKTNRGANGRWSMESLHLAVLAVKASICSLNQAASDFGIPEATLRRYVKKESDEYSFNLGRYRPEKIKCVIFEISNRLKGIIVWSRDIYAGHLFTGRPIPLQWL